MELGTNQVIATIIGFFVVAIVMLLSMLKRPATAQSHNSFIDIVLQSETNELFDMARFTSTQKSLLLRAIKYDYQGTPASKRH